ncbi:MULTISPECIES: hypothetical protein [Peribacillus]|uniref:Uncharacterized protein n=1 Tax=Peribacillus asahii TaxID=228899 RepID=A0A398B1T5_9BACI|nr:hypothetical protein [Peribacillus asahii]AZV41946.1 hypothetical protein BAOM_1336 [Peribacillus asahii]RID83712.1 hypothetical protein D1953_15555 [Peribacillus asahii]USK60940.1 hypothetical protein LIT37_06355 [Peribacillus asahii]USK71371.1 hypothetical protein LIS76_06335 [Peribacillus asahii]USK86307.1 hypothetical protein LIT35_06625 [Peribacillus asahii]
MKEIIQECFIDALGMPPTDEQVDKVIEQLPAEIVALSEQHGANDADVREKIYVWVNENINDFL